MYLIIVLVAVSLSTSQCLQLPYRVGLTDPLSEQPNPTSPQGQARETHNRKTPVESSRISTDDENTDSRYSTQILDENMETYKNISPDSSHKSADVLDENTNHRSTKIFDENKNPSGDSHRSSKSLDEEINTHKLQGASQRSTIVLVESTNQNTRPTDHVKTVTSDPDKDARQSDISEGSQSTSVAMQEPASSLATTLLQDIRDALQTQHDANLENRLAAVIRETEGVSGEVARLSHSVDQRVDLLMDSLATLRLAVAGQAQQLVAVTNALNHIQVKPGLTHSPGPHNIQSVGPHLTHSSGTHNIQSTGPHLAHSPGTHTQSTALHGIESPGHHSIHSPGLHNTHIPVTHGIQSPAAPSSLLHTLPSINVGTHTISHIKKHNHTRLNITEDMKDNHINSSGNTQENIDLFNNTNPIPKEPINPQQIKNQGNPSNAGEMTKDTDSLSSLSAKLNSLTVQLLQLQIQVRDVQNSVVHLKKTSQETDDQQNDTIHTEESTNFKEVVEKENNTRESQNPEAQQSENTDTTPAKEAQDSLETNQSDNTDKNPPTNTNKTQSSQKTQDGEQNTNNTQHSQKTQDGEQNTNNTQHSQKTQDTLESPNNPPKTLNGPKYTNSSTSPDTKITCECSTEELRNSIALLQDSHRHQQEKLEQMALNITKLGGVGKLEQMALNITKLGGGVNSGGFSQRLGNAEGVKALINDLRNLKEELQKMSKRGTVIEGGNTTDTSNELGMCVWPYRRGGGGCYYAHQDERLGWVAARDHCKGLQGRLAAPPRLGTLHTFLLKQRLSRGYKYWLGASNSGGEGEWKWSDGRSVEADVWGDAPPSIINNRIQRCLAIKPGYKLVASAELCRESRFFICQQERLL